MDLQINESFSAVSPKKKRDARVLNVDKRLFRKEENIFSYFLFLSKLIFHFRFLKTQKSFFRLANSNFLYLQYLTKKYWKYCHNIKIREEDYNKNQ